MRKVLLALAMFLAAGVVYAQDHIESRWYGLYTVVDYSYAMDMSKETDKLTMSELTGVVGFQFRHETAVGLGVTYLKESTDGYTQLPLFVELRSYYNHNRLSPLTVLQLGYSLPLGHSSGGDNAITINKGGIFFGASVGARFAINRMLGVSLFAGYQMIMMNEVEYVVDGLLARKEPVQLHLVRAGIGLNF